MSTQRWRNHLVAEVWWRRLAFAVPCPREPSSLVSRYGLVAANVFEDRAHRVHTFTRTPGSSSQSVGINGRMLQETREDVAQSSIITPTNAKAKTRAKDSASISQRAAQIVNGVSTEDEKDKICPRNKLKKKKEKEKQRKTI